jgi:hypothetical protein
VRPFTLFGRTGLHGHLVLAVTVPPSAKLRSGRAKALVAISAVDARRQAQVQRTLHISDMVVSLVSGPIVSCQQMQTVHVAYRPHVPLRVVLLLPKGRHLSLTIGTDGRGNAVEQIRLRYVRATSPVRIGVQVSDATRGAHRMESAAVSVSLPQECQTQAPSITVGG